MIDTIGGIVVIVSDQQKAMELYIEAHIMYNQSKISPFDKLKSCKKSQIKTYQQHIRLGNSGKL